jgi:hypothetical protein
MINAAKKFKNKYRCACCNKIRPNENQIEALWTQFKPPKLVELVCVCLSCANYMDKCMVIGVKEFKEWKSQNLL